jgi:hypothetical protein
MAQQTRIAETLSILVDLGMPRAQQNERSALTLLALLNLTPDKTWSQADAPLMGITPIMNFIRIYYGKDYAPNTRETIRRQTIHQFVAAAIALYNPDVPSRPVNSPKAIYQIEANTLTLLRTFGSDHWAANLKEYLTIRPTLIERYASERKQRYIPVQITSDQAIRISSGGHSQLIKAIIEEFAPRFAPGSKLIYVGDTGDKWGYFDKDLLAKLGVTVDLHGKMPDVVLYYSEKNWLLLIESVTSHGPVNAKRHDELMQLFSSATAGLVYITAFPSKKMMTRHLAEIAWETEVWVADAPSHLIHFNGERFLGPYN